MEKEDRAAVEGGGGVDQVSRVVAQVHRAVNEAIEGVGEVDWGVDEVPRGDCEILMKAKIVRDILKPVIMLLAIPFL